MFCGNLNVDCSTPPAMGPEMIKPHDTARAVRHGFEFMAILLSCLLPAGLDAAATEDRATPLGAAEVGPVAIEPQALEGGVPYATEYRASRGDCAISWIAYDNEPGIVKYQPDCPAPLAQQLPLLHDICSTFLRRDRNAAAFRTLSWGRLAPDSVRASREMSLRLALAAFRSSGWDKVRGRPVHGNINRYTRDLANQEPIYPELRQLFVGFQRSVTLSHVEKVLVLKAGQLPFFSQLEELGVKPSDRLPFDFMAWFAITPAAGP
jgi:hypothetical protein